MATSVRAGGGASPATRSSGTGPVAFDEAAVVRAQGLTKRFGAVAALKGATVDFRRGEILAIVGENGAGKSTLLRIVAGVFPPDSGEILVRSPDGEGEAAGLRRAVFGSPLDAAQAGIAMVHQELSLVPTLTVAENLVLGREPAGRLGLLRLRQELAHAARTLEELGLGDIDPTAEVRRLSPAQRQLVEIAKAWSRRPRLLILDEPTSGLNVAEVDRLLALMKDLAGRGVCVVFVSHRLDEVFAAATRIVVMKDGEVVGSFDPAGLSRDDLVRLMVGRPLTMAFPQRTGAARPDAGPPLLEMRGGSDGRRFFDVSLAVRAGEIVGLGGLEGHGQREVIRALFGLHPLRRGEIRVGGRPVRLTGPADALRHGLAFVPEDRREEGLMLPLSVRENLVVAVLRRLHRAGVLRRREEARCVKESVSRLRIRADHPGVAVHTLSGGNQQKVVFGRWLLTEPRVLLLHEPTRGIDVEAKVEIYHLLRSLAGQGMGILLVSSDMVELIGLCDRIAVLREGRVAGTLEHPGVTEEAIMRLASGVGHEGAVPA